MKYQSIYFANGNKTIDELQPTYINLIKTFLACGHRSVSEE